MKTYYIEKMDKPSIIDSIRKINIKEDNCYTCLNLDKDKHIKTIIKKLIKSETTNVVLSKEISENKNLVNALNAYNIDVFDGRWLIKYLSFEILDCIITKKQIKKEQIEIAITSNEITDLTVETIKKCAKQYKRVTVVTRHLDKLRKIEKEIYEKEGIMIIVTNNIKKSLLKSEIILNIDFSREILNKYQINENAIIVNLEGYMKIDNKRFNGILVNDYEIEVGREEIIWRENMKNFKNKDNLEAVMYTRDTFNNIRRKILKNKITIKELYGINGKIERFS